MDNTNRTIYSIFEFYIGKLKGLRRIKFTYKRELCKEFGNNIAYSFKYYFNIYIKKEKYIKSEIKQNWQCLKHFFNGHRVTPCMRAKQEKNGKIRCNKMERQETTLANV